MADAKCILSLALCLSALQIVESAKNKGDPEFHISDNWDQGSEQTQMYSENLFKSAERIISDTDEMVEKLAKLRLNSIRSIPFEVGYLIYHIQEEYRRMVDKYKTVVDMGGRLYMHELMFYLEDVEYHFWKIEHLANMLHEVERKYGRHGNTLDMPYVDLDAVGGVSRLKKKDKKKKHSISPGEVGPSTFIPKRHTTKKRRRYRTTEGEILTRGTRTTRKWTRWWHPLDIDYGWEVNNTWME